MRGNRNPQKELDFSLVWAKVGEQILLRSSMKLLPVLSLSAVLLGSCIPVYYNPLVRDMPYRPRARHAATPVTWNNQPAAPAATPAPTAKPAAPAVPPPTQPKVTPATPQPKTPTAPVAPLKPTVTPKPTPAPATPTPAPEPAKTTPPPAPVSTTITQPSPAPAVTPDPAKPTPVVDKKSITNEGAIPVATPVEGDPTRVWNPLDQSRTLRITDKNGNPHPSGKKLKVPGTNFQFYVP